MSEFKNALNKHLYSNISNYHLDNYDVHRYGKRRVPFLRRVYEVFLSSQFLLKRDVHLFSVQFKKFDKYIFRLENMYDLLEDDQSKLLMLDLVAYRILGLHKIKLSVNNSYYWKMLKLLKVSRSSKEKIDSGFKSWPLHKFDLREYDFDINLFFHEKGVLICFLLGQYEFENEGVEVKVEKGDVVLDCGGCWGDTALKFAHLCGPTGKVFSFEFIPGNLSIFERNLNLNKNLKDTITIIENPLWNEGEKTTYYSDNGPASRVSFQKFDKFSGVSKTKTIDDVILIEKQTVVDFIKMDIEGAEIPALEGAVEVIKKFKPKLAISIYHSMDDFVNISKFISDLDLGYKFYLGHYTIHESETVLYAKVENR